MIRISRIAAFIFCLAWISPFLYSLEVEAGAYSLRLYEETGRFALSYGNTDLLFNDNPRSSHTRIRIGDSVSILGEDKSHSISIGEFRDGVALQYLWDDLQFNQHFSFLQAPQNEGPRKGNEQNASDQSIIGVKIRYQIINTGTEDVRAELTALFDTVLGELGASHFATPSKSGIIGEYEFSPGQREPYIRSGNSLGSALFLLSGEGIRGPRRTAAANWKRLNESSGDFRVSPDRNFNLLPFSINDSALNLSFGPERIPGQSRVEYSLVITYIPRNENDSDGEFLSRISKRIEMLEKSSVLEYNPALHGMTESASDSSENISERVEEVNRSSGIDSFRRSDLRQIAPLVQSIETIDLLLEQIDRLLTSPARLDASQIRALEEILETIRQSSQDTGAASESKMTESDE